MNAEKGAWIVQAMSEPSFYDHPVGEVELIETHISWVFLAGDFAYKVKKKISKSYDNSYVIYFILLNLSLLHITYNACCISII